MTQSERYDGQVERARAAGLSLPTIESVKQGCYSDEQLSALIDDLAVRNAARMLIFGAQRPASRYSREEALAELVAIKARQVGHEGRVTEDDHGDADDVLLKLIGDAEIAAAFERIEKWYA